MKLIIELTKLIFAILGAIIRLFLPEERGPARTQQRSPQSGQARAQASSSNKVDGRAFAARADIQGPGVFQWEVVGESHYTESFLAFDENPNSSDRAFAGLAELFCDDNNVKDSNAVAVLMHGRVIGYVPAALTLNVRQRLARELKGVKRATCVAKVLRPAQPGHSYSVWLDLPDRWRNVLAERAKKKQ